MPANHNHLVVMVGPTAVGKTDLSIQLAKKFNGEIVSSDSRLFYRGMDLGTAKPSLDEQKQVRHHLIDILDPDQTCSLSEFQRLAKIAIENIQSRRKLPILVGGTGQYTQAVLEEWQPPVQPPVHRLRGVLEAWSTEIGVYGLHSRLMIIDPVAACSIQPQNVRRTIRALEVIFQSGERFSKQKNKGESPYSIIQIGLMRHREELFSRIDDRIKLMIDNGLVEEVKRLLDKGYSPELPAMSAIGYKEIAAYLTGTISLEEAIILIKRKTRQFVRRQANWFKISNPNINWFYPGTEELYYLIPAIEELVSDFINPTGK